MKELEEESQEKEEEPTSPVPTETEAGIVVTCARQCQRDAFEEEECLRQKQDRPVVTTIDSVDHREQAEGAEDFEIKKGQAEAPGVSQVKEQCTERSEMVDWTQEFGAEDISDSVDLNEKEE